jgi:hypothetical protein
MPSFPRTLRFAVSGAVVATALVACGTVTIRHDLYGAAPAPAVPSALASATPTPASSAAPAPAAPSAPAAPTVRSGTLLVGDSVMLGAKAALAGHGRTVDAIESRQFHTGVGVVTRAVGRGTLPATLVVHLGTNGTLAVADCRAVVDAAGPDRRVFFVTPHAPRSWIAADIAHLTQCRAAYPAGQVVLIDWNGPASRHPAWFYSDGIHLNGPGRTAYAALISAALAAPSA